MDRKIRSVAFEDDEGCATTKRIETMGVGGEVGSGEPVDMVNHPPHYTQGGIEVIDFIEAWDLDYHRGNAIKYILRAPFKGKAAEDIEKAIWYLRRYRDNLDE